MDDGIINLIKNEVPNDYCKLLCVQVIENENQNIDNYYIFQLYPILRRSLYTKNQSIHKRCLDTTFAQT